MKKQHYIILTLSIFLFCTCAKQEKTTLFHSLSPSETSVHFSNRIIENDTFNILTFEYVFNGGGVGIGDFNNDGLQDMFFSGNMVDNQLYVNKGNFKFEDVTEKAGVAGKGRWNSGVAVVDINNDGWLDIYVCATTYSPESRRRNSLFVNQGVGEGSTPIFKDQAADYGIDDSSSTTTAAFFDYDNDGDLDLFLAVNQMDSRHSPNTYKKKSTDGSSVRRDKLFRNDFSETRGHPVFTDVSLEAGITIEGFSLGLNIVDINKDGWKDVYITNDYLTNDLFYVNNGDGTFTNRADEYLKHTSYSAMGNDVVDFNNDAQPDIIAVDMLPEDNFRRKTMLPPNNYTGYINNKKWGFQHQYVRNTLQLNRGEIPDSNGLVFSEIALFSGISSTDWSWTPMVADFDNDGLRDLIVTNGFPKDVTDRDFIDYNMDNGRFVTQKELHDKIPSVKIRNYAYRNVMDESGIPLFEDVAGEWGITEPSFSNGAAYADFDNDGDLDYVVNNINDSAFVFKNQLMELKGDSANWLKIKFSGNEKNVNGIGAIVEIFYGNGKKQYWENTPYRGYLSSVEAGAHFGLGKTASVEKLIVKWPESGKQQVMENVATNQILELKFEEAKSSSAQDSTPFAPFFKNKTAAIGIDYLHPESDYIDFNVQRLLLHKFTQFGPGIAVSDVNGDGLDDFYVGGSHFNKGRFFIQNSTGQFAEQDLLPGEEGDNKKGEELGVLFFDADGDGDDDLYLVHGGYEFKLDDVSFQDQLFKNENGRFAHAENALPKFLSSGSCVRAADYDRDGDLDLFVGGRVKPSEYPLPVSSYILKNDGTGNFVIANEEVAPVLTDIGLVCDALWTDFDNDGWQDLMIAGEWMPLQFLKNREGKFSPDPVEAAAQSAGFWNSLAAADFDLDGDMDYIAGNLGMNTLLRADEEKAVGVYAADFDGNGGLDAVPSAYFPNQEGILTEYPFFSRLDIEKQTIKVKGIFPYHSDFGVAKMEDYLKAFPEKKPLKLKANWLKSSYLENLGNGEFTLHELPTEAQLAPVFGISTGDFNGDGLPDVLLSGNDFGSEVGQGRMDALNGLLLLGDGKGGFRPVAMQESGIYIPGDGKSLAKIESASGGQLMIAGQNQGPLLIFGNDNTPTSSIDVEPMDCAALITLADGSSYRQEVGYGAGFLSQSTRKLWLPEGTKIVELIDFQGNKRKVNLNQNLE